MTTPVIPIDVGTVSTVTGANAVTNNTYSAGVDKLTIAPAAGSLLADFELAVTFGGTPSAGCVQLCAMDYSVDGTTAQAGVGAGLLPRVVGTFSPGFASNNSGYSTMVLRLNAVPLTRKTDFYLYNNATGQQINTTWVLKCQRWTPGT